MSSTTREDHLAWCKERALEYVDAGEPEKAMASLISDLGKHPETAKHLGGELGNMLFLSGNLSRLEEIRKFIEGFN